MRLSFNSMQTGGTEQTTTFVGDQQGLKDLAEALNRAAEVGVTRVVIHNDNSSLIQHIIISSIDTPEAPVLSN